MGNYCPLFNYAYTTLHTLAVDRGGRTTKSRSSAMCSSHVLAKNFPVIFKQRHAHSLIKRFAVRCLFAILNMITPQELENAARGYVTLEGYIKVREEELSALYRDSSAAMVRTRRLVVAIGRLGQVADFPNQRFEALVVGRVIGSTNRTTVPFRRPRFIQSCSLTASPTPLNFSLLGRLARPRGLLVRFVPCAWRPD